MAATDAKSIAVATHGYYRQVGVGDLGSDGDRQDAPVSCLESIGLDKEGQPAGASNARHDQSVGRVEFEPGHGLE